MSSVPPSARVVVLGSINLDLVATAPRFPHPGETVLGDALAQVPGGKGANQAVAAARAGGATTLVGSVGDDDLGRRVMQFLADEKLDLTHVSVLSGVPSGIALITVVPGSDNTIVPVLGANAEISADALTDIALTPDDVVVLQFGVRMEAVLDALEAAQAAGATVVLNAAPAAECPPRLLRDPDVLVVNETELAMFALGDPKAATADPGRVAELASSLDRTGVTVVTLGPAGVVVVGDGDVFTTPARATTVVDTTGAGDCFVGNLAARLAVGDDLPAAVRFAVTASSLACETLGAGVSMPTGAQTRAALGG